MKYNINIIIMASCMMFVSCMGLSIREFVYVMKLQDVNSATAKFSPDGNKIAAGYSTGEIIIWDANTYNPISVYKGEEHDYFSLDFSPDGKYIAYGARHEAATLFDIENNYVVKTFPAEGAITPRNVKFSPDGRYIAVGYSSNRIIIWDVETGSIVYQFIASTSPLYCSVTSVAFSPDGKRLISADNLYRINIWNLENGSHERRLTGDFRYDIFLAVNYHAVLDKSGDRIISGSGIRREITIWDTESGEILKTLPGNRNSVYSLCVSPDGNIIAAGSMNAISLWDISSGKKLLTIRKGLVFEVAYLDFHPANNNILMTSGSPDALIRLWDITNGKELMKLSIELIQNKE